VNKISQFMHDIGDTHWLAGKRILCYLKRTITSHGFVIQRISSSQLTTYKNEDWDGCPDDRKSISGYCDFFEHNLILGVPRNNLQSLVQAQN
jgi:hypothetical protein